MTKKAAVISFAACLIAMAIGIAVGRAWAPGAEVGMPAHPAGVEPRPGGPSRTDQDLGKLLDHASGR